jgi:hypothetical protein
MYYNAFNTALQAAVKAKRQALQLVRTQKAGSVLSLLAKSFGDVNRILLLKQPCHLLISKTGHQVIVQKYCGIAAVVAIVLTTWKPQRFIVSLMFLDYYYYYI